MSAIGDAPRGDDGVDPVAALEDLPAALCEPLARAVRRAADALPRSTLPGQLRPLAGWRPQGLTDPRARRAMAAALGDARFREQVRSELDVEAGEDEDVSRLARRLGEPDAVAALAAAGRWRDLAVLAAQTAQSRLEAGATAAEPASASEGAEFPPAGAAPPEVRGLRDELESAQRRAQDAERRAAGELARANRAEARIEALTASLAEVRAERDALAEELARLRRRHRDRVSRLRQRAIAAESRAAPAQQERRELAEQLELLAQRVRGGSSAPASPDPEGADQAPTLAEPEQPSDVEIPRELPAAKPGRPSVLPPGVSTASPAGVRALLRTPGIVAVIDGYNVTKDSAGRPGAPLEEQRRWLVTTAAEAAARFGCRPLVVFDGAERHPAASPTARDVRVAFSPADEEADDHIVALVAEMGSEAPVAVVTSDKGLRDRVEPYGVDVVTAGTFLAALQG